MQKKTVEIPEKKTIALVAHDHCKDDLLAWALKHEDDLLGHRLLGTGTTARLIRDNTKLEVRPLISGPLGGDQQLGSLICQQKIDLLIFFWDPLESLPHDPDVKALLRVATLYNIAMATSSTTANYLISSPLFRSSYCVDLVDNGYRAED